MFRFAFLFFIAVSATIPISGSAQQEQTRRLTLDELFAIHSEAISLGKQEFITNMMADPELVGLDEQDYIDFQEELLQAFLNGTDDGSLVEFTKYAPQFTIYVLTFPDDFPLSKELAKEVNIAALIARQAASIARQLALERLIETLSLHSK